MVHGSLLQLSESGSCRRSCDLPGAAQSSQSSDDMGRADSHTVRWSSPSWAVLTIHSGIGLTHNVVKLSGTESDRVS